MFTLPIGMVDSDPPLSTPVNNRNSSQQRMFTACAYLYLPYDGVAMPSVISPEETNALAPRRVRICHQVSTIFNRKRARDHDPTLAVPVSDGTFRRPTLKLRMTYKTLEDVW